MMFTNDEALALSLGLAAARGRGLAGATQAIAGRAGKLERLIPATMKRRIRSIGESISFAQFRHTNPGDNSHVEFRRAWSAGRAHTVSDRIWTPKRETSTLTVSRFVAHDGTP
jgi:predicted DNA-binding transcriptional regulator YafY